MIKRILATIFILVLITSPSYSQIRTSSAPGIYIQEVDGDPASRFRTIKVTNGALTDNSDGSATIDTGGGSGATELDGLTDIGTSTAIAGNLLFSDGSQFNAHGDSPTDEYCLTYEATGATLAWQTCSSGSGATELDGLTDVATSTATTGSVLISDGTYFNAKAMSGDVTIATDGTAAIQANSVALTTDTSGNYAAGDGEAGNATAGDTATSFFSAGAIEMSIGGTGRAMGDPDADRILFWDDGTGIMEFMSVGSGLILTNTTITASSLGLDDLTDVATSTATSGSLMIADGTNWNSDAMSGDATIATGGAITIANDSHDHTTSTITLTLDGLTDIGTSTATAGHILQVLGGLYQNIDLQVAMGAETSVGCITVFEPDKVQAVKDNVPMFAVESTRFPNGIEISQVYLKTDASSTYSLGLEKWSSPADGSPDTLTTIATSTSTEANEAPDTEGSVGTSEIIMVDLSVDDVNWIEVCVDFVEPSL